MRTGNATNPAPQLLHRQLNALARGFAARTGAGRHGAHHADTDF
jgi:hypothetical protein